MGGPFPYLPGLERIGKQRQVVILWESGKLAEIQLSPLRGKFAHSRGRAYVTPAPVHKFGFIAHNLIDAVRDGESRRRSQVMRAEIFMNVYWAGF